MSQSLADSDDPLSSFPPLSSSFLLAGSSPSRISKACWNSLAAYWTQKSERCYSQSPRTITDWYDLNRSWCGNLVTYMAPGSKILTGSIHLCRQKRKEKGFSDWRMARTVDNVVTRWREAHRPPALKCDYLVKFSGAEGMGGSVVLWG